MIATQVVAEVRRVLRGHSDRALVHAVDGEGLEYKLEVPLDVVRALSDAQGHVVTITYAIHTLPGLAPAAAELDAPSSTADASAPAAGATQAGEATAAGEASGAADPAAVDAEFMALMNRRSAPAGAPMAPSPTSSGGGESASTGPVMPTAGPSIDAVVAQIFGLR